METTEKAVKNTAVVKAAKPRVAKVKPNPVSKMAPPMIEKIENKKFIGVAVGALATVVVSFVLIKKFKKMGVANAEA